MPELNREEAYECAQLLGGSFPLLQKLRKQCGDDRIRKALIICRPTSNDPGKPRGYFIAVAQGRSFWDNERARANGVRPGGKTPEEIQQAIEEKHSGDGSWLWK